MCLLESGSSSSLWCSLSQTDPIPQLIGIDAALVGRSPKTGQFSAIHLDVSSPSRTTDFPELNEHIIAESLSDLESVTRSRLFGSCAAATPPYGAFRSIHPVWPTTRFFRKNASNDPRSQTFVSIFFIFAGAFSGWHEKTAIRRSRKSSCLSNYVCKIGCLGNQCISAIICERIDP